MKILAIETSCDETAVSIVDAEGEIGNARFTVLGNAVLSQVEIHREYGGVFPALAKREHAKNLIPILTKALEEAGMLDVSASKLSDDARATIEKLLEREHDLARFLVGFFESYEKPPLDAIAVTSGPGLEPALWVGINFAKALALAWGLPTVPINHMEGHVISSLIREGKIGNIEFPALALLISGGHTELVLMKAWLTYELVGSTLDDAVGEAFDKVARMLGLPYPGGPQISKLAESARAKNARGTIQLPRPMLSANNCDFSFSGLKTAALYALRELSEISDQTKETFAREFEDAVTDVLVGKTRRAMNERGAKTLVVGGGVSANNNIRKEIEAMITQDFPGAKLFIPARELTTDNAVMIAAAGYFRLKKFGASNAADFIAEGNLSLI